MNFLSTGFSLPQEGFVRLQDVLKVIPVSKAKWYQGIAEGVFPPGHKLGHKLAVWNVADIRSFIASVCGQEVA